MVHKRLVGERSLCGVVFVRCVVQGRGFVCRRVTARRFAVAERVHGLLEGGVFKGVLVFPAMHHYHIGDEAARLAQAERVDLVARHLAQAVVRVLHDLVGQRRY